MKHEKELKELISESGFTVSFLAEKVLEVDPSYLSSCIHGRKNLSKIRTRILRDYLEKVAAI